MYHQFAIIDKIVVKQMLTVPNCILSKQIEENILTSLAQERENKQEAR